MATALSPVTLQRALDAFDSIDAALLEFVFGSDVTGDGYLVDSNVYSFKDLANLFDRGNDKQRAYVDGRYPRARERYESVHKTECISRFFDLYDRLEAMLPLEPRPITFRELTAALPTLLRGGSTTPVEVTSVFDKLRDVVLSEGTADHGFKKQAQKFFLPES